MEAAEPALPETNETLSEGLARSRQLKAWAREAGFDRAGVASARPSRYRGEFLEWLERGDHAEMAWLERGAERRLDVRRVMPGCRSVLSVALHYAPLIGNAEAAGDLWPKVARYARGDDYHDLLTTRLDRLASRIEAAYPGCATRRYVDTGPVLEREVAQAAGLGCIGKNTNLLHRDGSWFLLGELLLTLELAPDEELTDMCGSCRRCLDACPTNALPEPYRLDSRRCISYWTIEHRGAIPEEWRDQLAGWVFGCDICQEVCPWNVRPDRDGTPPFEHPELELAASREPLDLVALLGLDRTSYTELFRGSPMKRAKLSGLKRNAAVAMAASGEARYTPALERALGESDPIVRGHAAWALGQLRSVRHGASLERALARESDAAARSEMKSALEVLEKLGYRRSQGR